MEHRALNVDTILELWRDRFLFDLSRIERLFHVLIEEFRDEHCS